MKKLFIIFLSAIALTAFAQQKKVAVYVTGDDANVNKVLGSKLVQAIGLSGEYTAVERTTSILAELNREHSYQHSGEVDDDELSRLGKQFGVKYVCAAIVSRIFNEDYISIRLIDVESAQVERTASSNKNIQSYEDLTSTAKTISDELFSSLNHTKQSNSKKVAVYVIKNDASRNIGRVLGDKLVAGFTNSGRYIAVERTNGFLSQIKKEQNYQREGVVDDEEIARIGKQFGVQYVCVAEVSEVYGKKHIDARLVNVETAEIENSFDVGGQISNMNDCIQLTNQIASNLSKGTFKEQKEEARVKAEEERIRAEQEARRLEQERLRKMEEERLAEQRRKEAEEKRIQALVKRPWRELLTKVVKNVPKELNYRARYIGDLEGGRSGIGLTYWTSTGSLYCGYSERNEYSGYGMYISEEGGYVSHCKNGWVHVGEYKNYEKNGKGSVYDHSGRLIYRGSFFNGRPTQKYPSQEDYSAYTFEVINYNNGDKYVGELKNGQRSGHGLYMWENGDAWYGQWKNDTRNGYGIMMYYSGSYDKGTWENGTKVK